MAASSFSPSLREWCVTKLATDLQFSDVGGDVSEYLLMRATDDASSLTEWIMDVLACSRHKASTFVQQLQSKAASNSSSSSSSRSAHGKGQQTRAHRAKVELGGQDEKADATPPAAVPLLPTDDTPAVVSAWGPVLSTAPDHPPSSQTSSHPLQSEQKGSPTDTLGNGGVHVQSGSHVMQTHDTFKTRRGNVVRVVRERYVRSSLPCHAEACRICESMQSREVQDTAAGGVIQAQLDSQASHFLMPDW